MKAIETKNDSVTRQPCMDSQNLGFLSNGKWTIGFVDEVNGGGCAEFPEFIPTRHELVELLKHWTKTKLDLEYDFFLYAQTGSTEFRQKGLAMRRINPIIELIGDETAQKAVDEAEREFSKDIDPKTWAVFKNGTPAEWEAIRDEVQRQIEASFEQRSREVNDPVGEGAGT